MFALFLLNFCSKKHKFRHFSMSQTFSMFQKIIENIWDMYIQSMYYLKSFRSYSSNLSFIIGSFLKLFNYNRQLEQYNIQMRWLNLVALGFKGNRQINQNIVEEIFLSSLPALKVSINKSTDQCNPQCSHLGQHKVIISKD